MITAYRFFPQTWGKIRVFSGLLFAMLLSFSSCRNEYTPVPVTTLDTLTKDKPGTTLLFGIPVDSLNIIRGKIRANTSLAEMLKSYGIQPVETDKITRNSKSIFNVREMRAGNNFTALTDRDSSARLRYFIYENDPTLYYIFSFNDSLHLVPFRVTPRCEIKHSSITIETSLWDALIGKGLNPELAVDLSDIYAWTVDFFGLQKGDNFKFYYEENFIGDKSIGTGRIICALFSSPEKRIYALPMIQDEKEAYYDSSGISLRKEFLKAPLHFSRIASGFSSARLHPVLRIVRPHYGVDYAAPVGTPVYSIGDGTITSVSIEEEAGRIVKIRHNSVYSTAYMHLSGFAKGILTGVRIKQGEVIGYVGSSGLATGPHLDFRFYKNGYAVNPLRVEAPPVDPVKEENKEKFRRIESVLINLLNSFN